MKKPFLLAILALLSIAPGALSGQENQSEKSSDWSIGYNASIGTTGTYWSDGPMGRNPHTTRWHRLDPKTRVEEFGQRRIGISVIYKGFTLNLYHGLHYHRFGSALLQDFNFGYQYSFSKFKENHKVNLISGLYVGVTSIEFGLGIETEHYAILATAYMAEPWWLGNDTRDFIYPEGSWHKYVYNQPDEITQFMLKFQYKL